MVIKIKVDLFSLKVQVVTIQSQCNALEVLLLVLNHDWQTSMLLRIIDTGTAEIQTFF